MAKKLDDVYRDVLWKTSLTTNDLPYIYISGGNFGFLQLFHDVYNKLLRDIMSVNEDYFMEKATFSLVANQQEYTLPADLTYLRQLELQYDGTNWAIGTERKMGLLPNRTEAETLSAASISNPIFHIIEDSIFVYPEPDTAVTNGGKLFYIKMPAEAMFVSALSAASATFTFPQEFDYLINLGCAVEIWNKYGLREQKADEIARYQNGIEEMKRKMKPRVSTGQRRMLDVREIRDGNSIL